jgi:hypothetical protein
MAGSKDPAVFVLGGAASAEQSLPTTNGSARNSLQFLPSTEVYFRYGEDIILQELFGCFPRCELLPV